jgi:hypothetical protein
LAEEGRHTERVYVVPITIPAVGFIFSTEAGNQPASQLDSNLATIRNAVTGVALQASDITPAAAGTPARLTFASSTQIQLGIGVIPLKVAGNWNTRAVSAVVTIANTGLAASALFYVYAFDNAGVTTLEIVTTAHVTDPTFGVEVKSGDATRTYVGVLQTGAGAPGVFVPGQVNSWFGPRQTLQVLFSAQLTGSAVQIDVPTATITVVPHSANSTFLVSATAQAGITNVAATNTTVSIQTIVNAVGQSNSFQSGSAPSAGGGIGWQGPYAWQAIVSPATAAAFIVKLQFVQAGGATATCGPGAISVTEIV